LFLLVAIDDGKKKWYSCGSVFNDEIFGESERNKISNRNVLRKEVLAQPPTVFFSPTPLLSLPVLSWHNLFYYASTTRISFDFSDDQYVD